MNMTPAQICKTCRKPKANYPCGICEEHVCKSCAHFMGDGFSFLKKIPKDLSHQTYCSHCYDDKVSQAHADYNATMEKAKEVIVFTKERSKLTGHLKRKEDPVTVEDCEDEEETLMRLAFFAAQEDFNCILDVKITHRKIIVGSHKKTIFSGTAIPITIDPSKVREF